MNNNNSVGKSGGGGKRANPRRNNNARPRISGLKSDSNPPVSKNTIVRSFVPRFSGAQKNGDMRIIVQHEEMFTLVVAGDVNDAYKVDGFQINPGLPNFLPWLSSIARNFETYEFESLIFEFRSSRGTQNDGKIMIAVDWNAAEANPTTLVQYLQNRTKIASPVWQNCNLVCDAQDLKKFGPQRFVRGLTVPAGEDIKTYDLGRLLLASVGCLSTLTTIGEVWVKYKVHLITPEPSSGIQYDYNAYIKIANTNNSTLLAGTLISQIGPLDVVYGGAGILTFKQPGRYIAFLYAVGTGIIAGTFPTNTGTVVQYAKKSEWYANLAATIGQAVFAFEVTVPNQVLTLGALIPAFTTLTEVGVRFAPYNLSS